MTGFAIPASAQQAGRCPVTIDNRIRCEHTTGHTGRHTNGLLTWHDPPLIVVGDDQHQPDLAANTERWRDGNVLLFHQATP